jgi:hypothetical protein
MNPVGKKKRATHFLLQQAKDMRACQKKKKAKIRDDTCLNHKFVSVTKSEKRKSGHQGCD